MHGQSQEKNTFFLVQMSFFHLVQIINLCLGCSRTNFEHVFKELTEKVFRRLYCFNTFFGCPFFFGHMCTSKPSLSLFQFGFPLILKDFFSRHLKNKKH